MPSIHKLLTIYEKMTVLVNTVKELLDVFCLVMASFGKSVRCRPNSCVSVLFTSEKFRGLSSNLGLPCYFPRFLIVVQDMDCLVSDKCAIHVHILSATSSVHSHGCLSTSRRAKCEARSLNCSLGSIIPRLIDRSTDSEKQQNNRTPYSLFVFQSPSFQSSYSPQSIYFILGGLILSEQIIGRYCLAMSRTAQSCHLRRP